jgi:nitrite reductase/ring-hydroxylating ferredoxin subunit
MFEERMQPPPSPTGWYALAFSSELAPGDVRVRHFFGREVVVFRTMDGRIATSEAYCPHLGAHLGHGGRVEGESLRCAFHGFRFDASGACVAGYPGKRVPPRCRLSMLRTCEKNGIILAYFHPENAPAAWELPDLDTTNFRPLLFKTFDLAGHPQETSENSVDVGHFGVVHGYEKVAAISPMTPQGPLLHGHYTMVRGGGKLSRAVTTDFKIWVWGLGYSIVEAHVREHDLLVRTFVLATPSTLGRIDLRIALSLRRVVSKTAVHPLAAIVPRAALESILERFAMRAYEADVRQDFEIWNHKTFLSRPALADGDGPIGVYRKWVRQFYPAVSVGDEMRRLPLAARTA